jgi:hypothetical protein
MVWTSKKKPPIVQNMKKARLANHAPVSPFVQMIEGKDPMNTKEYNEHAEKRENSSNLSALPEKNEEGDIMTNYTELKDIESGKKISRVTNFRKKSYRSAKELQDDEDTDNDSTTTAFSSEFAFTEADLCYGIDASNRPEIVASRQLAEEGPKPFQLLAFLGGIGMILTCIFDFQAVGFHSFGFVLINFYAWVFGIFIAALEGTVIWVDLPNFHRHISNYVKILRFMWGRGLFYMFTGSLIACLDGATAGNICGLYMMIIGLFIFIGGIYFQVKLGKKLRFAPKDKQMEDMFATYDVDKDGYLNQEQFRDFALNLRIVDIDKNFDFDAEFEYMDSNNDGLVNYHELKNWIDAIEYRNQSILTMFEDAAHYLV